MHTIAFHTFLNPTSLCDVRSDPLIGDFVAKVLFGCVVVLP